MIRRRTSRRMAAGPSRQPGTYVLALALLIAAAGLVVVAVGPWRIGVGVVGSALLVTSFARTVLPDRQAGLLRIRRATADVTAMTALGVAMVLLALLVPDLAPR